MGSVDFFYFFGSVYAYLPVMRIGRLAEAAGVTVRWRPFNVRPLMKDNNVALRSEAQKVRYMARDFERRAALHGLACGGWPSWPTDPELRHNLVGALAAEEGWIEPFTVLSFDAWVNERMALGDDECLSHVLGALGKDVQAVIAEAATERVAALYEAQTAAARSQGIFGSPSFVVDGEMFWGDDRLEDALLWAQGRHPLQPAPPSGG
jgi:2-hydroxychromene-2-carboxylate isomerase